MPKHNLMKDPAYAQMLYAVESRLAELDKEAAAQNITLTDSNVRSIYVRAANIAKGKTPAATAATKDASGASANPKDQFLNRAVSEIANVRDTIIEEHDLPDGTVERRPLRAATWIAILDCLKDSCATRTGPAPGSRGYLDFLHSFLTGKIG